MPGDIGSNCSMENSAVSRKSKTWKARAFQASARAEVVNSVVGDK